VNINPNFMQGLFYTILSGGALETSNYRTSSVMFASLRSNVISVLRSKHLTGVWKMTLAGDEEGRCTDWNGAQLPPKYMVKN